MRVNIMQARIIRMAISLPMSLTLLLGWLIAAPAVAQQSVAVGDFEVHYSSINTNRLTPEIASAYGIQRSGTQAMLNITILERASGDPVEAEIQATATNLTGQRRDVSLRQIEDQGAIYYIGQFRIHNEETLNFRVEVLPDGHEGAPLELTFRQQFYTG